MRRARSKVWGKMTRRVTSAPHWPLLAPYMTDITQPNWRIPPYSMRQSPHGCVPGCKEYNSNISIDGRKIQGVPYNARQRQRSLTIYKCSKQTVLRTMTTHWDVLANFKISHAIAPLSTNPSCAPKRFRGKNYSHSAAARTETQSKASNPHKRNQKPTRMHKVWS